MVQGSGWEELRAGRWEAARAAFEAADETAEALEGLSWAAWWLDDAETVFDARERAYRRYREDGDVAGAARMATWLAADELDFHGAAAVAQGWLQRRTGSSTRSSPGRTTAGSPSTRAMPRFGEPQDGGARAGSGRRSGAASMFPTWRCSGSRSRAQRWWRGREVEEGMRCLDEATAAALAGDATIPISSAWTCCILVTACIDVLDYERASEWCDRIAEFADRYGSRYMLGFCRAEYGTVHLWRGRWEEAEALLEASSCRPRAFSPGQCDRSADGARRARRRQGRTKEAAELLEQAGASAAAQLCRARHRPRCRRPADRLELLERPAPGTGQPGPVRLPALELLVRARVAARRARTARGGARRAA